MMNDDDHPQGGDDIFSTTCFTDGECFEAFSPPSTPKREELNTPRFCKTPLVVCPVCDRDFSSNTIEQHIEECLNLRNMLKSTGVSCLTPQSKSKPSKLSSPNNQRDFTSYYDAFLFSTTSPDQQRKDEQMARQLYLTELKDHKKQLESEEKLPCDNCGKYLTIEMTFFMDSCEHVFCEECLRKFFLSFLNEDIQSNEFDHDLSLLCPAKGCCQTVPSQLISSLLSEKEYSKLLDFELRRALKHSCEGNCFVTCPNKQCNNIVERIQRKREDIIIDLEQQKKSANEVDIHREQFRFRCRVCSLEFCSGCLKSPFHEGFTCESFSKYLMSKRCRYCDSLIDIHLCGNVCDGEECKQKANHACCFNHSCGHACCGIKDENSHLPCLMCSSYDVCQSGDDYCNICWISPLIHAPCIQLKCGHIFHFDCVKKKLEKKWHGSRINFSFEKCPLCNTAIEHPSLKEFTTQVKALKSIIEKKSLAKLEQEGLQKIVEISAPSGKFYNKPLDYAMSTFSFYMCHECKTPYYGGRVQCGEENEIDHFNPEELVCGSCCAKKVRVEGICDTHGSEFIVYKCKFCCNVASWFCWGTTHFCDKCHKKQVETQILTKMAKNQLPKCLGVGKCPTGGNHADNGEECILGCSLCSSFIH